MNGCWAAPQASWRVEVEAKDATAPIRLHLRVSPLPVATKFGFGTSHSFTRSRLNALVQVAVSDGEAAATVGTAEVGLPPRKPGCYEATLADVVAFASRLHLALLRCAGDRGRLRLAALESDAAAAADPLLPRLDTARETLLGAQPAGRLLCAVSDVAHRVVAQFPAGERGPHRAALCGVDTALLDALGRLSEAPLHRWLGLPAAPDPPLQSFYTVAMSEDGEEALRSLEFGAARTGMIKLKVGASVEGARAALAACAEHAAECTLAVDANAAWTPALAREMTAVLLQHRDRVVVVEQPFPVELQSLGEDELAAWEAVCGEWKQLGWDVVADESMRTAADVPFLARLCTGVNIKLEKCGGPRAALQAVNAAGEHGLRVWVGIMVGTALLCSAPAHLLSAASYCDLDGSLLVASPVIDGGYTWGSGESGSRRGEIQLVPGRAGHGCVVPEGWEPGTEATQ